MLDVAMLHRLLICDAEAGKLVWRERTPDLFNATAGRTAGHACSVWNARYANRPALASMSMKGYLCGHILSEPHAAHRTIWAMAMGRWPNTIDHLSGDRSDNRISNMRDVTMQQNARNKGMNRSNSSGHMGVSFYAKGGNWEACIQHNRRKVFLGRFDAVSDAVAARKAAETAYGYHPNHGRPYDVG